MNANQPQYHSPPPPPLAAAPAQFRPKNKFLTFAFACIPGAGQMYHGLMKKGASLMLLFWGITGAAVVSYLGVLTVLLPVLWFYSFFDTVNRMNMSRGELQLLEDQFLFGLDGLENSQGLRRIFRERHLIVGWVLIAAACWMLLNGFFTSYWGYHFWEQLLPERFFDLMRSFVEMLPSLVIPTVCVLIGLRLIKGSGKKAPVYNEYTVPDAAPVQRAASEPVPAPSSILDPGPLPKAPAIDELFDLTGGDPEEQPDA